VTYSTSTGFFTLTRVGVYELTAELEGAWTGNNIVPYGWELQGTSGSPLPFTPLKGGVGTVSSKHNTVRSVASNILKVTAVPTTVRVAIDNDFVDTDGDRDRDDSRHRPNYFVRFGKGFASVKLLHAT